MRDVDCAELSKADVKQEEGATSNPEDVEVPPVYVGHGADKELVELVHRDIMDASPNIRWEDIAKLEDAKRLLQGKSNFSCSLRF